MIKNRQNILLITEDNTIIEYVTKSFNGCEVDVYADDLQLSNKYDLVIVDDFDKYNKIKNLFIFNIIINISNNAINYNNVVVVKKPFYLKNLLNIIKKSMLNLCKVLNFKIFKIVNGTVYYNDMEENFGNKELDIIKYLLNNGLSTKDELLNNIWGYNKEIETRVFENTINKIKQKLKNIGIDNFIILIDKKYCINPKFL